MTYADHDVHWVQHGINFRSTGDSGPDDGFTDTQQFEVTQRGLAPDELAELRLMRAQVGVIFDADGAQDSTGSVRVRVDSGFNLSGDEFLSSNPTFEQVDNDASGTNDYTVTTKDTDEVGQLFTFESAYAVPYDDDTSGNGAGGLMSPYGETINFADALGSGPFVDSADDFVSRLNMAITNNVTNVGVVVRYGLYYNVTEIEGGRTRFGR